MFDLRKLEVFCKVCELNSFSKAGKALFLSQPTISAHIQTLERELNVRLIDRMGRTVLPTPAGRVLWQHAKQAFAMLEKAKDEISALASEISGEVIIGSNTVAAHHVLPTLLTHFLEEYPDVQPRLTIASSREISHQVQQGDLMLGILTVPEDPGSDDVHFTPLIDDEIVIIAPPNIDVPLLLLRESGNGFPPLPAISFASAATLPWIMRNENSRTRKVFDQALMAAGYNPNELQTRLIVDSSHAALQYVVAGLGVSIAPRLTVEDAVRAGRLRAFRIDGVTPVRRLSCAINTKRALFPAASVFLEFLHTATSALRGAQ